MTGYIAIIHKDAESDFGVAFPDFPGCVSAGRTPDEARVMAEEALALHVDGMRQHGLTLPPPSSRKAVMGDHGCRDGVAIVVAAPWRGSA